jgi:hypothetical protein
MLVVAFKSLLLTLCNRQLAALRLAGHSIAPQSNDLRPAALKAILKKFHEVRTANTTGQKEKALPAWF